jgi:hypothetical protein
MTISNINTRTSNRRKVLDKADIPLATKLKTLTIDVKAFLRRFRRSQTLNTSNSVDRDYASLMSRYFSHAAAVNATPRTELFGSLLASLAYYQPLPLVLLDESALKVLFHELEHLTTDANLVDGEYLRAENGLHENERKLREVTITKSNDELTTGSKSDSSDSKGVAVSDNGKKKAEDRLIGYKETRETAIQNDIIKPLKQARATLNNNLEHHHCIMKTTYPQLVAQLPSLRGAKATLDLQMGRNDESTASKRREMKELTKKAHSVGKSIKDIEGLTKYFAPRIRRHATSNVDNLLLAMEITAVKLREATGANSTWSDVVTEHTGLTIGETMRLIVQPAAFGIASSITWAYAYAFGVQWALIHAVRFIERHLSAHRGRQALAARQKNPQQHVPFDGKGLLLTASAFLVRLLNAVLATVTMVLPLVLPLLCIWMRDNYGGLPVRVPYLTSMEVPSPKDVTLPTGRVYRPLLYMASVLGTSEQCRNVCFLIVAVVAISGIVCQVLRPTSWRTTKAKPEGRRLGTK